MAKTRIPVNENWLAEEKRTQMLSLAVAELALDLRTINGLEDIGVIYVRQLVKLSRFDLAGIQNFGEKSVDRIVRVLAECGLSIRDEATA
ncbi:DNA-directed RNA polymerase subunit alpha C-terminal domain-containing protein [Planctomycetaceae bacterium SH139]